MKVRLTMLGRRLRADKKALPVTPWFYYTLFDLRNDFSKTERGGTLLLGFLGLLHGRSRGEGEFRFFGFIQDQKEPVCLSGQAIHSAYQ
jgi:hypothetical protein